MIVMMLLLVVAHLVRVMQLVSMDSAAILCPRAVWDCWCCLSPSHCHHTPAEVQLQKPVPRRPRTWCML